MISYLLNRQYKKITQCLPEALQNDQPDTVYLPSYANLTLKSASLQQIARNTHFYQSNKLKIKDKTQIAQSQIVSDRQIYYYQSCLTCYSIDNIIVKYYSKKHVCVNCRKFLRDQHGNQIKLFVSKDGEIICFGIYKIKNQNFLNQQQQFKSSKKQKFGQQKNIELTQNLCNKINHKVYYHTDYMKLFWNGKSAFATFAGEDQMIVLLRKNE